MAFEALAAALRAIFVRADVGAALDATLVVLGDSFVTAAGLFVIAFFEPGDAASSALRRSGTGGSGATDLFLDVAGALKSDAVLEAAAGFFCDCLVESADFAAASLFGVTRSLVAEDLPLKGTLSGVLTLLASEIFLARGVAAVGLALILTGGRSVEPLVGWLEAGALRDDAIAKSSMRAPRFFKACFSQIGRGPRPPHVLPAAS